MQQIGQPDIDNYYRYEALFNNASMGIVVVDNQASIRSINPFALGLFGYTVTEILGRPIETLIPQRYHHHHVKDRNDYIANPKSRPMGLGLDLFGIKKNGSEFPVEVSLGSYTDKEEKYVIAFVSDISVRKNAEAEIVKLNNDLELTVEQRTHELTKAMRLLEGSEAEMSRSLEKEKELGELKSRFVSMASHEFRTPLSTILSSTYLIEKYTLTEDQNKRDKHLQRIISSVSMLTDILNDFLSVGKIEEGKIQVRITEFNIKELMQSTIEEIKNNLKKNQQIAYEHEGNTMVCLDTSLLRHIIMNLVSNASKFSPETGTIEIKTIVDDSSIILSVKDFGIGISSEDQKHLMERFFRGANASMIQGTGLGLHIVSKYSELLNGNVVCNSVLEEGTAFIITFQTIQSNEENIID
ncbi:MAG: PAS domain-containing sensor histidine kinase [Chitinophagaceae bacterium]